MAPLNTYYEQKIRKRLISNSGESLTIVVQSCIFLEQQLQKLLFKNSEQLEYFLLFPIYFLIIHVAISETTNYQDTATSENIKRSALMEALLLTSIEMKSFPSTSKSAEDVPPTSKDAEPVPSRWQDIDYESTFTFSP